MKNKWIRNRCAEGYVNTALKIIIAVVVGGLLLGGLYLLFRKDDGVVTENMNTGVEKLMDYNAEPRVERQQDPATGTYRLSFSYDGSFWSDSFVPDYGENATVTNLVGNGSEENPIEAAVVKNGSTYYVITSTDGGVHFSEQVSFTAADITHCYYGTSAQLPAGAGSFQGEKFVIRYHSGGSTYYTMVSDGTTWVKPTWSDVIPIG